ncbi:MAG: hypothetical protein CM15mV99_120 [Caudoviricetes sp.]|nr:MAG: hypothetical protein CM15mV99_120 [Caudoviricetes sp.]
MIYTAIDAAYNLKPDANGLVQVQTILIGQIQ